MNICLLCNEYPPAPHGGIGPVTRQLAEGLLGFGHKVHVVGVYGQSQDSIEAINGVRAHRLSRVGVGPWGEVRTRLKLADYVSRLHEQERFDLVEAPEWRGDSALLRLDCPVVLRLHTSHIVDRMITDSSRPSQMTRFFENLALRRASAVCSVSADIARKTMRAFTCFEKRGRLEKVPVILNAIELSKFTPASQPRLPNAIGFAGSLKPIKGIENLLKAFERVLEKTESRLVLAGPDTKTSSGDSYLDYCFSQVSAAVRERVEVLGRQPRDQVAALFRQASVVVLPSLQEACPMVVMEAMACGAPVIFGACGPHDEIIEEGIDGLTCDPYSPDDIAARILQLFTDPAKAANLGTAARLRAERDFTEERFLRQTLDFYAETINRSRQGKGMACH